MPSARPSASKPGPRLALDAGTRTDRHASLPIQFDLLPAPAGIVRADNELQRAVTVLAGDERFASGFDRVPEVQELALNRRGFALVVLNVPAGQLVARDDGRALCPVDLQPLRVAGPERRGRLQYAGRARAVPHKRADHVFGLDLVHRVELPVPEDFA